MAFSGEFQHGIDEKGRLIIPASFRKALGEKYMLQKGQEGCLFAYPMASWAKLEEGVNDLSDFVRENRDYKRRFFSASREGDVDKQGRTLIYPDYREYAQLTKDVYILGVGNRIEIWDKANWETYRLGLDDQAEGSEEAVYT